MTESPVSAEPSTDAEPWPRHVDASDDGVASADLASRWRATGASRRRRPVRAGALVLIVVLAFGAVWYFLQNRDHNQVLSAQRSAATAARADALLISDYNYQTLDRDYAAVEKASTPAFAAKFKSSLTGTLQKFLVQYKATSKGQVQAVGVEHVSGSTAVVAVFLDQTVTNSVAQGKPTTQRTRAEMTLVHSGDRWLLSDLRLV
ncbi:MAG: hypothetical protein ACRDZY_03600 [Acidimicrobiales bacterium]